jgi:PHD/YefM family antitoxin component YafN of YafNO toxin-antitoxin module
VRARARAADVAADVEKERASVAELPEGEEKEAVVVRQREKEAREA